MLNKSLKIKLTFLLLLMTQILSGCAFKDIDKTVFVAMIALDKSDEEDKPYKVTLKLYEPTSSFKEATEPQYSYLTKTGETLSEAIRLLESYSDKEMEFGHSKIIIIGEDLVKENRSNEILDFLLRRPDIQLISWITVARPNAEEIIKLVPQGESAAYPELFNYFSKNGTESPYIVTTYLFDFRRDMEEEGKDSVLPLIEVNKEETHFEINKSLIVAHNKKPYELNSLNTSIYNMLAKNTDHADLAIDEEGEKFISKIDTIKPKLKVIKQDNHSVQLDIKVSLFGYISEAQQHIKNRELPKYNQLLKKEAEKRLSDFINEMKTHGFDPLGFGVNYKAQTLHNKRMSVTEWENAYKDAKVNIMVKPGLKSTGSIQ